MAEIKDKKTKSASRGRVRPGKTRRSFSGIGARRLHRFGRTIAVTIENNCIHLVTSGHTLTGVRLYDVSRIMIPGEFAADDRREDFIARQIHSYLDQHRRRFTRCILAISGKESAFRLLSLPEMPKKEIDEAIYWEGNKQIPFRLDNAYFGYQLVNRAEIEGRSGIPVALTAFAKKEVDVQLAILDKAEFQADGVYYIAESVGRLLSQLQEYETKRTHVIVHIKQDTCDIDFYMGRQLTFTHSCSIGSDHLAEDSPLAIGITKFSETLVSEVQNSFDYYLSQYPNVSTETVYVYGDQSDNEELIAELSMQMGFRFQRFPLKFKNKARINTGKSPETMSLSLGTVAAALSDYHMVDFLPAGKKEIRDNARYYRFAVPALITLVMIQIGFLGSIQFQNRSQKERQIDLNGQIERFRSSPSYILYHKVKRQITADRSVLSLLENEPTFLNLNLKEISRITPIGVKLDQFELSKKENGYGLYIMGKAISSDPPPEIILAEYIARLERSPFYDNIILKRHIKRKYYSQFIVDFELEMATKI